MGTLLVPKDITTCVVQFIYGTYNKHISRQLQFLLNLITTKFMRLHLVNSVENEAKMASPFGRQT